MIGKGEAMAQLQFGVIGHKGRMGQALEAAITPATKVLMPVHLFGRPVEDPFTRTTLQAVTR